MGLAIIEYFNTLKEAEENLPRLKKEWKGVELIIIKEDKTAQDNYSICAD